jgi:hypothetical protein
MCATPGRGNVPSLGRWNSPSRATFSPALIPSHDYRETRAIRRVWMRVLATSSVSVNGLAITPSQAAATTYVGGTDDELEALWGQGVAGSNPVAVTILLAGREELAVRRRREIVVDLHAWKLRCGGRRLRRSCHLRIVFPRHGANRNVFRQSGTFLDDTVPSVILRDP